MRGNKNIYFFFGYVYEQVIKLKNVETNIQFRVFTSNSIIYTVVQMRAGCERERTQVRVKREGGKLLMSNDF